MAKVKRVAAPAAGVVMGREARLSTTQEGVSTPSEIRLLGVDRCLRFVDDSCPFESQGGTREARWGGPAMVHPDRCVDKSSA